MPTYDTKCPSCDWAGEVFIPVNAALPVCPHCLHATEKCWTASHITRDEIPGGMWVRNLGPKPVFVRSHSERIKIMKDRGLMEVVDHVPDNAGTDKSKFTTSWIGRPACLTDAEEAERVQAWHAHEAALQAELRASSGIK